MIEQAKLAYINRSEFGEYILTLQFGGVQDDREILRFQISQAQAGNMVADLVKYLLADIANAMPKPSRLEGAPAATPARGDPSGAPSHFPEGD